jgi:hypothetical protein
MWRTHEWFFIEQAKIRSIYASMYYPEQEAMAPNGPPFDSNWPVAPPPSDMPTGRNRESLGSV